MIVQVKKKVLVLDQAFLQPDAYSGSRASRVTAGSNGGPVLRNQDPVGTVLLQVSSGSGV
jgi:hypothetical protein